MAQVKITKIRSVIKRPKNQKLTMEALGLRKMGSTITVEHTPQIQGMITVVRHLVKIEEV
ncbi:MAG TPA: 50S ribosomal protein L30 [Rhodothermales bacterium]|nr:50S ribosomal protein L30 [Rhodothermales bacterium]